MWEWRRGGSVTRRTGSILKFIASEMVESTGGNKPQMELEVEHVFGFRTYDCQQNL